MAGTEPGSEPAIDVDSLDDAAFADFKTQMRSDAPAEDPKPQDKTAEPPPDKAQAATSGDGEADDGGKTAETVPHGQFHRERERRKAAEAERQQLADNYTKLLARTQALIDAADPKPVDPPAPTVPEWKSDPINAGEWTQHQLIELKTKLENDAKARDEQVAADAEWNTALNTAMGQYQQASQADPTVAQAYIALQNSYGEELLAVGHTLESARAELAKIEKDQIRWAVQSGVNVAEHVVKMAKARGWRPQAAQPAPTQESDGEKLAKREEARLAAQSLGAGGGGVTNTGKVTPEALLEMSDAEFAAYKKSHGGSVMAAFL